MLAAEPATAAVYASETTRFGDWTVVCDNLQHCTALGLASSAMRAKDERALLVIEQDPGGRPRVTVALMRMLEEPPPSPLVAAGVRLTPRWDKARDAWVADGGETLAIFAARPHAPGEVLSIDSGKAVINAISLDGAAESLAWMRTKLAQPPPERSPPARLAPTPKARPLGPPPRRLIQLSARLTEREVCGGIGGSPRGALRPIAWLNDRTRLWGVACDAGGAHARNESTVPVIVEGDGLLRFARLGEGDDPNARVLTPDQVIAPAPPSVGGIRVSFASDEPPPVVSELDYEPSTGLLVTSDASVSASSYAQGWRRYGWTGKTFVLVEETDAYVHAVDGDENAAPYFSFWPPSYRAIPSLRPAAPRR